METQEAMFKVLEILGILATLGFPPLLVIVAKAFQRQLKFSPALAFAYTYFNNFIAPLHARLVSTEPLKMDGSPIDRIYIRMPEALSDVAHDRFQAVQLELRQRGAKVNEITVQTTFGNRTLAVLLEEGQIIAFDVPRILSTMDQIITEHRGEPRSRNSRGWRRTERREIQNFCRQLRTLIKQNGYQDRIKVFNCDVTELTHDTDDLEHETSWFSSAWIKLKGLINKQQTASL